MYVLGIFHQCLRCSDSFPLRAFRRSKSSGDELDVMQRRHSSNTDGMPPERFALVHFVCRQAIFFYELLLINFHRLE